MKSAHFEEMPPEDENDGQYLEKEVASEVTTTIVNTHQRKLYNGDFIRGDTISNGVRIVPATISVEREKEAAGLYIIAIVAGISAAATVGLIVFGIGYYKYVHNQSLIGCCGKD